MSLGTIGLIGRFRPLHIGAGLMLDGACSSADFVKIGVGSSNKYDVRNPFTAEEVKEMISAYLNGRFSNYEIYSVPDSGHLPEFKDGKKWKSEIVAACGKLDHFVSGNPYVASLLKDTYDVIHPVALIPPELRVPIKGSMVRMAMAVNEDYSKLIPPAVADYMKQKGLVERFRAEFGLETLAQLGSDRWRRTEDVGEEIENVVGGC